MISVPNPIVPHLTDSPRSFEMAGTPILIPHRTNQGAEHTPPDWYELCYIMFKHHLPTGEVIAFASSSVSNSSGGWFTLRQPNDGSLHVGTWDRWLACIENGEPLIRNPSSNYNDWELADCFLDPEGTIYQELLQIVDSLNEGNIL